MSLWGDIGDFVSDVGDVVVDVAEGAVDAAVGIVEAIGGAIADVIEAVGDAAADALESAAEVMDVADDVLDSMTDIGEAMLTAMDDVVFDTVDFVTVGFVDIDYDEGVFGASFGIDDVFGASMTISEEGFDTGVETLLVSADLSYGEDGFATGASAGADWGPLPYVEGHVSVDEKGNVGVGGEFQVYLPTPAGLSGVEVGADYQETDEGYQLTASATGGNYAYTGTYAKAGVHTAYEEDADGYRFQVGAHGEVGQVGVGSVTASIDYVEGREGDRSYEGVTVGAGADGFGASAEVEASYTHLETPDGEIDVVAGSFSASGGGNTVEATGGVISGPGGTMAYGEVTHDFDELGLVTSAAEIAGDAAGVGGPGDLGLPDLGVVKSTVGETATGALGDAATGAVGTAATEAFGEALAESGLDDVAQEAVQKVVDDASATVQEAVEETASDAFAHAPDELG